MRLDTIRFSALIAAISLAACGGGGGGTSGVTLPTVHASASPAAPAGQTAQVTFRIGNGSPASPSSSVRTPKFVSPSMQSATVSLVVNNVPSLLATVNITASSQNCTTGQSGLVCTVTAPAPLGTDTFSIGTYSGLNGTGSLLSTAITTDTLAANATNLVSAVLNGVVASATVVLGTTSVAAGTAATTPVNVAAYDAQSNLIIGPGNYSPAIGLTNSDTSGATQLSATQILAPGAAATLTYNGASSAGATITPTVSGVPGTAATFTPTGYAFSAFTVPNGNSLEMLTAGPDGNVWFAQTGTFGNVTPAGNFITYTAGVPADDFYALSAGPGSTVWYGGVSGDLGSITTGGAVTPISTLSAPEGCGTNQQKESKARRNGQARRRPQSAPPVTCGSVDWIGAGPDGYVWFSDENGLIGSINPATGAATEWDITQQASWPNGDYASPWQFAFGSDGNIYAGDSNGTFDKVTVANHAVTDATQITVANPCEEGGYTLAIDASGNLWTSDQCANILSVPMTNFSGAAIVSWSVSTVTNDDSFQEFATAGGNIWAIDYEDSNVYRISNLSTSPSLSSLQPFGSGYYADLVTQGPDGNIWADASTDGGSDAVVKVVFGTAPPGSLSLIRKLPPASHTMARNALQRGHRS